MNIGNIVKIFDGGKRALQRALKEIERQWLDVLRDTPST